MLSESSVGCRAELNVNKGRRMLLLSVAGQSDQTYCKLLGRIGKTMNYSPGLPVLYIFNGNISCGNIFDGEGNCPRLVLGF